MRIESPQIEDIRDSEQWQRSRERRRKRKEIRNTILIGLVVVGFFFFAVLSIRP